VQKNKHFSFSHFFLQTTHLLLRALVYSVYRKEVKGLLLIIVFGAIVVLIASMLMGANEGMLGNIILGIIGAIIGGFIMNAFG